MADDRRGIRVLGLDPSLTSFGFAKLSVTKPEAKSFSIETDVWKPKARGVARLHWFKRHLLDVLEEFDPHHILIEGYAYARGNQAHQIGELGGMIRLMLHEMDQKYVEIAPSKLKKFAAGKGNAKKEIVMVEAYKRFALNLPTNDETDAAVLAIMGAVGYTGLKVELPKVNMDALHGINF